MDLSKPLKCLAKSDDFVRKLPRRFIISEDILTNVSEADTAGPLLCLPFDILLVIYDSIGQAASQVTFGLTCKRLARVAQKVDLTLNLTSPRYAGFLPVEVFDVPDLIVQLRPWMPSHLVMCGHCLTYRPAAADYWRQLPGYEKNDFWIQKNGWVFKDTRWKKQIHDICPACHWTCSLSDYIPCDGCRALGRLGDVDWDRVSDSWRRRPGLDEATSSL